jgi:hypothetical protein
MLSKNNKSAGGLGTPLENVEAMAASKPELITGLTDVKDTQNPASAQTAASMDAEYPSGLRLGLIITSAFISMFLVSLVSKSTNSASWRHRE